MLFNSKFKKTKLKTILFTNTFHLFTTSKKKDFFSFRQHPLSQTSFEVVEPYTIPTGNYSYLSYPEQKSKFFMYIYLFKTRMYFCQKRYPYDPTFSSVSSDIFLLESTKEEFLKLNSFLKLNNLSTVILAKYLLLYFAFTLTDTWYKQPKIIKYIRRLYFFETGYRYSSFKVPVYLLKNIYVHSLFNGLLRCISLEKKNNKNFNHSIHPFLDILKNVLYTDEMKGTKPSNFTVVHNFFIAIITSGFIKDNYIFVKEFEPEILAIIKHDYNKELMKKEKKLEIFLINYFIKDFFIFLQRKDIHKFMHFNRKLFKDKRDPHSFFFVPKQKKGGVV